MTAGGVSTTTAGRRGVTLRKLGGILKPWRWLLAGVGAIVIAGALLELVPPLLVKRIIDGHLMQGQTAGLPLLACLYLGAVAASQVTGFLVTYLTSLAAQGALCELRIRLFAHLQTLSLSYHDRTPLGDTISRATSDVETVDRLFSSGVVNVISDLARVVAVLATMVALNPPMALLCLAIVPPLAVTTRFFQVRVRNAERANRRSIGLMNTHLQETLVGAEVILAFGRKTEFVERFRQVVRQTLLTFNRSSFNSSMYSPIMAVMGAVMTAMLIWSAAGGVFASWGISIGDLTAFVLLFQRFFKPITSLGDEIQTVQSAISGAERIFEVLAVEPERRDAVRVDPAMRLTGTVDLRDVTFGYLPGQTVLHRVSLSVQPGQHVAIVGRTGAGKSSVFHLIAGLYSPLSGSIRLSGLDPRSLADEDRRHIVGVVPQTVQMLSASVRENLTLDGDGGSMQAIEHAARITGLHDLIVSLPRGYDTPLRGSGRGEGLQLSAGQRQLLALTRALIWDPAVLLLDEATSAVDSGSEAVFRDALRSSLAKSHRSVITIAHRLATAREADRVVVMDGGRIVEQGAPAELLAGNGIFAGLLELESEGWDWRSAPVAPQ